MRHIVRILLKYGIVIISMIYVSSSFAINPGLPTVNVFSWWGYLVDPWVHKMIWEKCHARISYDEYYTNDDFMRRFHEYKELYDIIIFPDMDYQALKNDIRNDESTLYKNAEHYEKNIKKNYKQNYYQHNIAYFMVSIHGFIYNPKVMTLSENDTIDSVFEKAKSKIIVLSDEPIYTNYLLDMNSHDVSVNKSSWAFKALVGNSKIILSNSISGAYSDRNFAFAYTWPGIALYAINNKYKSYRYMIHPRLSFVYTDSMAELNHKPETQCVANVMASKEFLSKMQNDALYFSPYGDSDHITDKLLKNTHKEFFARLPKLTWLKPVSAKKYDELNRAWSYYFKENSINKLVKYNR